MANEVEQAGGTPPPEGEGTTSKAQQMVDDVKAKAHEAGQKMQEEATKSREAAADSIGTAAQKLRDAAAEESGFAAQADLRIADTMEHTAQYLKDHNARDVMNDFEQFIRDHPLQSVGGALVAGVVIGRLLK